jgi:membrane protease YdiL (CAAX protease family)
MIVAFSLLVLLMLWDMRFLKKIDRSAYLAAFQMPAGILLTVCVLFLLVLAASPDRPDIFPMYFIVFMLPLYVFRRKKVFNRTHLKDLPPDAPDFSRRLVFDAVSVVYHWLLGLIAIAFSLKIFVTFYPDYDTDFFQMLMLSLLSSCYLFLLVWLSSRRFSPEGARVNLRLTLMPRAWLKVFILPALLGLIFAFFSASVVAQRTVQPNTPLSEVMYSTPDSAGLALCLILVAILLAPLFEEVIFRGYFFHVISAYRSRLFAVCFIALFFGGLHFHQYWGDWTAMSFIMLLGFALSSMRALTGSTASTVVMHYVYNTGIIIFTSLMMFQSNPSYYEFVAFQKELEVEEQVALLEESIRVQPEWAFAYNDLARVYVSKNIHLEQALSLAEKAVELDPHKPAFVHTKIEILYELDRVLEARSLRDDLISRYPDWGKKMSYEYLDDSGTE